MEFWVLSNKNLGSFGSRCKVLFLEKKWTIYLVPAFSRSGSATTFLPSLIPGRYLTFSWQKRTVNYLILIKKK